MGDNDERSWMQITRKMKGIEFLQLALSGHLPSSPKVQAEIERVAGLFGDK